MSLGLAFRAFFGALFNQQVAQRIRTALSETTLPTALAPPVAAPSAAPASKPAGSQRSDALTLVSTLQREARFLDLVQEPLDGYSDAQVGAAARDVLRDTAKTLQRFFAIEKLIATPEGEPIELPKDISAARWRIVGPNPTGSRATLVHAGWQATQCNIPQWSGLPQDSLVLAPAEVEA
jgi:hypothetical protein